MPAPAKLVTSALPVVAMAALAGITWWLLQATLPKSAPEPERPKAHTPDYFADDFSVSELDSTGTTEYRLTAKSMIHYEDTEDSDLVTPAMRMFQPLKPTVTATGDRGTVNGDVSIVNLYDHARLFRVAGYGDPQMQADSQHFRILVNDDVIETEKPVKLQRGPSVLYGDAMNYNNVTRVLKLFGTVHGQIAASDSLSNSSK